MHINNTSRQRNSTRNAPHHATGTQHTTAVKCAAPHTMAGHSATARAARQRQHTVTHIESHTAALQQHITSPNNYNTGYQRAPHTNTSKTAMAISRWHNNQQHHNITASGQHQCDCNRNTTHNHIKTQRGAAQSGPLKPSQSNTGQHGTASRTVNTSSIHRETTKRITTPNTSRR